MSTAYRFSTHYFDEETGLYNAKRRYYHSVFGRFLSRDPIEEEGGEQLYLYALNNPIQNTDPFGEKAYLVYRPFASKVLKWFYPLVGHYYLVFDDKFKKMTGDSNYSQLWKQEVQSMNVNYPGFQYLKLMTFSFHPKAVRASVLKDVPADAGVKVSTFVTEGSFVAINDQIDIDGYHRAGKWFGLGRGRTNELTDDFCRQVSLFKQAVQSAERNNAGWPDPGNYQVLNQNCGTWAQLIINRSHLDYPLHESVVGNFGGGIGGISDLTKMGDITTFTLKSFYEMAEKLSEMSEKVKARFWKKNP